MVCIIDHCEHTFLEKRGLLPRSVVVNDEEDIELDTEDLELLRTCTSNHNK